MSATQPVVFCQTDVVLCDVLDLTQMIVFPEPDHPRLITLLGERHIRGQEYIDDDLSQRTSPGEFSITDYVMNTLQTNPESVVLVEQCPNASIDSISHEEGSATLREIPLQVTRAGLQNRMKYVDWRKVICKDARLITLVTNCNLFDFFRQAYLAPEQVDALMYRLTCLKTFVGETQNLPDLLPPAQATLDEMEKAIQEQFEIAQPGVEEYKVRYMNKTLDEEWVFMEVSNPLRDAWALVMDYFTVREALTPGPANEMIVVVGAHHSVMTTAFLQSVEGSETVTELTGNWKKGAKSCIPLYATVAVNPETCERLAVLRKPRPRPVYYGAAMRPQGAARRDTPVRQRAYMTTRPKQ